MRLKQKQELQVNSLKGGKGLAKKPPDGALRTVGGSRKQRGSRPTQQLLHGAVRNSSSQAHGLPDDGGKQNHGGGHAVISNIGSAGSSDAREVA